MLRRASRSRWTPSSSTTARSPSTPWSSAPPPDRLGRPARSDRHSGCGRVARIGSTGRSWSAIGQCLRASTSCPAATPATAGPRSTSTGLRRSERRAMRTGLRHGHAPPAPADRHPRTVPSRSRSVDRCVPGRGRRPDRVPGAAALRPAVACRAGRYRRCLPRLSFRHHSVTWLGTGTIGGPCCTRRSTSATTRASPSVLHEPRPARSSRSRTCPRSSRARCSPATRAPTRACAACSSTSSSPTST